MAIIVAKQASARQFLKAQCMRPDTGSARAALHTGRHAAALRRIPLQAGRVARRPDRRSQLQQPQAVFNYCSTQGNAFESAGRSFRATGLLLLRQAVDQENRQAAVRAAICAIYLCEIMLWVCIMVAMPAMVQDPMAGITSAQTGTLLAVGTLGSTIGKGVAAAVMDSIDPRIGMIGVLLTVGLFNAGFALSKGMWAFCFFWGVGRIFHSSGWVAATRLICQWTPEEERGASLGSLSFAARLGFMIGGAGLGGLLLAGFSWRFVFHFVNALCLVCAAVLLLVIPAQAPFSLTPDEGGNHGDYCITVPRDNRPKVSQEGRGKIMQANAAWGRSGGMSSQEHAEETGVLEGGSSTGASTATSQGAAIKEFSKDIQIWCAILGRCLLHIAFEFQAFLNLYVQQVLNISAGAAAQVAAGYSLGSAVAVLGGGFLYCRMMGAGKRNLVVGLCAAQAVGFWALLQFRSPPAVIALTILLGTAMSIPYYIPGPAFNLRRGGNYSAVLEGVTEMAAFGVAAVFDLAVGKVLPTAGWDGVIKMLLVCAAAGTAVMAIFMQQEKAWEENLVNA